MGVFHYARLGVGVRCRLDMGWVGAGLGLGDVVVLAEELDGAVVVLAEELVEDRESGTTLCDPS